MHCIGYMHKLNWKMGDFCRWNQFQPTDNCMNILFVWFWIHMLVNKCMEHVDCGHELFVLCAEIECQFSHTVEINDQRETQMHNDLPWWIVDFIKSKKQKHWLLDFATCTLVLKRNFISNMQTKAKLNNFLFRKTMKTSKIELMRSNYRCNQHRCGDIFFIFSLSSTWHWSVSKQ